MAVLRLDKYLAEMKKGSRSQVKELIRKGNVLVNDAVCKIPETKIDSASDRVAVQGEAVAYSESEYFMLNKPQGVVSATEDNLHQTVISLIDGALRKDLFPVGRLDIDTEGLLLITNDGKLAHELLSPKKHVDKVYFARVEGAFPENLAEIFLEGFRLSDETLVLPSLLRIDVSDDTASPPVHEVRLTIREGKFHQVKRMFETFGCHVVFLKRLSMGTLILDESLEPGGYRPLTAAEIHQLKSEK